MTSRNPGHCTELRLTDMGSHLRVMGPLSHSWHHILVCSPTIWAWWGGSHLPTAAWASSCHWIKSLGSEHVDTPLSFFLTNPSLNPIFILQWWLRWDRTSEVKCILCLTHTNLKKRPSFLHNAYRFVVLIMLKTNSWLPNQKMVASE